MGLLIVLGFLVAAWALYDLVSGGRDLSYAGGLLLLSSVATLAYGAYRIAHFGQVLPFKQSWLKRHPWVPPVGTVLLLWLLAAALGIA